MFKAITFDCFGTLLDWRKGQKRVLQQFPTLRAHGDLLEQIISTRGQLEMELEAAPWQPYQDILEESITRAVAIVCNEILTPTEARSFADGQLGWPAYADSRPALLRLADQYPLGLLSNCDEQTLKLCAFKHLKDVPIALFASSESLRSYKPHRAHWGAALAEFGCDPHEILHVSFSPEYDLAPASELGFSLCFIAREAEHPPSDLHIHMQAADIAALADQLPANQPT